MRDVSRLPRTENDEPRAEPVRDGRIGSNHVDRGGSIGHTGVETVAAATSTATEGLLALYRSIDTDSLDEVIAPGRRGSARSTVTVEFEYPRRRRDSTGGPSKFAAVGERRVRPDRDTD